MTASRAALSAVFLASVPFALADIDYHVVIKPTDSGPQRMLVTVTIPVRFSTTSVQIPNWGPGGYVLGDFWKGIEDFKVTAPSGTVIEPQKPNDYTWTVPTSGLKSIKVTYSVGMQIADDIGHYGGPRTYVYVVDRKAEKCSLAIDVPAGWNIATGLDGANGHFTAPNYDTLADNPVTYGKYRELRYVVDGKPHILALYGPAREDVDQGKLIHSCAYIAAAENDFFGNKPPYSHYVWHFSVAKRPDGGGGLEHLASTEIGLASGLGPGIIGVNAHEFFHLWNVKRIRSKVLGPFDYTKLPETGALWWLEGVTEYYAHQLMTRYGYWDDKKWYDTLVRNIGSVRRNPARLEVGPYESSFRVKDTNNGRGNSNGYKISYYDLGVLAGTCLDIEILDKTHGKYSLDDVELALWAMCKNDQPGFAEDEIRKQCVRFGGASLGEFYDRIIMHGGEMPMEAQLGKVGLELATYDKAFVDLGITTAPSQGGMGISKVGGNAEGKVTTDDVLLEVNGDAVPTGGAYAAAMAKIKSGDLVTLKLKRGDAVRTEQVVAGTVTRPTQEIREAAGATADQKRLREIWLYRGKRGWTPKIG